MDNEHASKKVALAPVPASVTADAGRKIDKETAEREFDRFTEAMDLDMSLIGLSTEDKADLESARGMVVTAIGRGSLVINDAGEPVFTPQGSNATDPITFHEPTGASLMDMDKAKKTADIRKTYLVLGNLTGRDLSYYSALKMRDLKVCLAVLTLFLG